jgi:hypothetical protein
MLTPEQINLYLGKQDMSPCLGNCSNNGQCAYSISLQAFTCMCFPNYNGISCSTDIRPCSYRPCLNNGACNDITNPNTNTTTFNCSCSNMYYGDLCQYEVDLCTNRTCSNNGMCTVNSTMKNETYCDCFSLYSGADCEIESEALKTIKAIITTASIIAITTLISFYALILLMDITKYFCCVKNKVNPLTRINESELNFNSNKSNKPLKFSYLA